MRCLGFLACVAAGLSLATPATALEPEQIAIIAVQRSPESREIARHYAQARGIPESQICLIDVPVNEVLERAQWNRAVRPAIRRWISENQLERQLRCLVTVWDVPLKIGKATGQSSESAERRSYLEAERRTRITRLNAVIGQINRILPDESVGLQTALNREASIDEIVKKLDAVFKSARARVIDERSTPKGRAADAKLARLFTTAGGLTSLLSTLSKRPDGAPDVKPEAQRQIDIMTGRILGLRDAVAALENLPESAERDQQLLGVAEKATGILGTLRWIDRQLELLDKNESYSSFDSELSLLYWPDYPLIRWQANVLHHRFDNSYTRWLRSTLMVARLEAPTVELTKRMIDTAVEIEQRGLQGRIYLDARGLGTDGDGTSSGSYADYDHSIRRLAELIEKYSDLPLTLDNKPELFQPGDCPQAALYCGWYSLAKYVDAFEWQPGAVAYHIASSEAETLRKPQSQAWCKRMLEDGVCATLGPTYEPYLEAFPRPDEFFLLLLSGRFTLAETYYRTLPSTSWVMTLVGDPLYNPFKNNPGIKTELLPDELKRLLAIEIDQAE